MCLYWCRKGTNWANMSSVEHSYWCFKTDPKRSTMSIIANQCSLFEFNSCCIISRGILLFCFALQRHHYENIRSDVASNWHWILDCSRMPHFEHAPGHRNTKHIAKTQKFFKTDANMISFWVARVSLEITCWLRISQKPWNLRQLIASISLMIESFY